MYALLTGDSSVVTRGRYSCGDKEKKQGMGEKRGGEENKLRNIPKLPDFLFLFFVDQSCG